MGADYKLPLALKRRLLKLMTEDEITERIEKHSEASRIYVEMELEGFKLKEEEILLIRDNYIQYQLFADVEMETLVEDKRVFLRDLISNIKKNKLRIQNENKEKAKRTMVF